MGIVIAIFIFGFIIFFHELGHFLLAKLHHIKVTDFSLGMGPAILKKQIGETQYCLRLLPIGGMCMMGEDEADDGSKDSFHSKSVWARISVIFAGPAFNFLLAFLAAVIMIGISGYDEPVIGRVGDGYPAQEAGLQEGDRIVKLGGKTIHVWREISTYNQFHQGETMTVTYERDGQRETTTLTPVLGEDGLYYLGISQGQYTKANILTAMQYGSYEVKYWIDTALGSLRLLVTGQASFQDMSGAVGLVDATNTAYVESSSHGVLSVLLTMFNIGIFLSANLGVMNLLPIPALDGGRLLFLLVEVVRRKRIPPEKEGIVHAIGMVLLLVLMAVILCNDLIKIITR